MQSRILRLPEQRFLYDIYFHVYNFYCYIIFLIISQLIFEKAQRLNSVVDAIPVVRTCGISTSCRWLLFPENFSWIQKLVKMLLPASRTEKKTISQSQNLTNT